MVEDHAFRIDHYKDLTIDWARTPDGHYYSNKAPGPVLLGFPVFWVVDTFWTARQSDRAARDQARLARSGVSLSALSVLFQALPFALLTAVAVGWLEGFGGSRSALHWTCVAMLFGSTASLFMSSYFGHGMAAVCVLGLCLSLVKRRYARAGLVFGLALLSDYSSALLLPGFLTVALVRERRGDWAQTLGQIAAGGVVPGVVWVAYHGSCFGGPFTLPGRYQNPMFVDTSRNEILGLFGLAPRPAVVAELLAGWQRGLLWSQPWLLLVALSCPWWGRIARGLSQAALDAARTLAIFLLPSFLLLLWMNASFGQWEGGATPGPRYMCSVFPAFGLLGGLLYDHLPSWVRRLLIGGVVLSAGFWILATSTSILVPAGETMWGHTLGLLAAGDSPGSLVRFAALVAVFEWQLYRLMRGGLGGTPAPTGHHAAESSLKAP
jgi:hypothetical protein